MIYEIRSIFTSSYVMHISQFNYHFNYINVVIFSIHDNIIVYFFSRARCAGAPKIPPCTAEEPRHGARHTSGTPNLVCRSKSMQNRTLYC